VRRLGQKPDRRKCDTGVPARRGDDLLDTARGGEHDLAVRPRAR
jgi:hypothetical protein